jgi:hypothetical protein
MSDQETLNDRVARLEARANALDSMFKAVLTTFVIRGIIFKADIPALLKDAAALLPDDKTREQAWRELDAIAQDLPNYQRAAMGPGPDPDFEDH